MDGLDEKRKTATNSQSEIIDARVIANYGDPGLQEDYQFDLLSQYVIVMSESFYRVPTTDRWWNMIAVVQRPKHLWITTNQVTTPSTQQRLDAEGNVNVGLASSYSIQGIQAINQPYALGEQIKIKRLQSPYTQYRFPSFFNSQFQQWGTMYSSYGSWHTQGSTLPYINSDSNKVAALQTKTIIPAGNQLFYFNLTKYQYEAAILTIADPSVAQSMTSIFNGSWNGATPVYTANGGYLFNSAASIVIASCEYEDINIGNKYRVNESNCIPLAIMTPNNFPSPKTRNAGTIAYTPSYSPDCVLT
jgi:hypothetical protein